MNCTMWMCACTGRMCACTGLMCTGRMCACTGRMCTGAERFWCDHWFHPCPGAVQPTRPHTTRHNKTQDISGESSVGSSQMFWALMQIQFLVALPSSGSPDSFCLRFLFYTMKYVDCFTLRGHSTSNVELSSSFSLHFSHDTNGNGTIEGVAVGGHL